MKKPCKQKKLKTAIVYDRANTAFGGAERLLVALMDYFQADLFSPVADLDQAKWLQNQTKLKTSFLNSLPLAKNHHQIYAPLMPLAVESFDLSGYDLVISVTSAESKAVLTKPNQVHLSYLLTPPRYLYQYEQAYLGDQPNFKDKLTQYLSAPARAYLRWFDQTSILRPDIIVPLSQAVHRRALDFYPILSQTNQLKAPVYPFATDLTPLEQSAKKQYTDLHRLLKKTRFNLSVARLVKYKRIDLAIKASLKLGRPLLIVGQGVAKKNLEKLAGAAGLVFDTHSFHSITQDSQATTNHHQQPPMTNEKHLTHWLSQGLSQGKLIFFMNQVDDAMLALLYHQAQFVIAPGVEDFGLVPLEAAYFNTPSIINTASGVAEILTKDYAYQLKSANFDDLARLLTAKKPKKTARLYQLAQKFSQQSYLQKLNQLIYDYLCHTLSYK